MKSFAQHLLTEARTDDATKVEHLIVFAYNCMYGQSGDGLPKNLSKVSDWDSFYGELASKDKTKIKKALATSNFGDKALENLITRNGYTKAESKVSIAAIKDLKNKMNNITFLIHAGSGIAGAEVSSKWTSVYGGGSDTTPKTDFADVDKKFRMSLKAGEGRYMATKVDETKAIVRIAMEKSQVPYDIRPKIEAALDEMMRDLGVTESGDKVYKVYGAFDTKDLKKQFTEHFVEWRTNELVKYFKRGWVIWLVDGDAEAKEAKESLEKTCKEHAKAEASIFGFGFARANAEKNLICSVTDNDGREQWIDPFTNEAYDLEKMKKIILENFEVSIKKYFNDQMVRALVNTKLGGKKYKVPDDKGSDRLPASALLTTSSGRPIPFNKMITYTKITDSGESQRTISLGGQRDAMKLLLQKVIASTDWQKIAQEAVDENHSFPREILREAMTGLVKFGDNLGTANYFVETSADGEIIQTFEVMNDAFFETLSGKVKKVSIDMKGGDDKWQIFTMRATGRSPEPQVDESFRGKYIQGESYRSRKHRKILESLERKHSRILEKELLELEKKYFGEEFVIAENLWNRVSQAIQTAGNAVGNVAKSAMRTAKSAAKSLVATGARLYQFLSEKISTIWNRMKEMVSEYFTQALSWLKTFLPDNFFNLLQESGIEIEGSFEIDM